MKIQFKLIVNEDDFFHGDLIMKVPLLKQEFVFDTYYLVLGKSIENETQLIEVISDFLLDSKEAILRLQKDEIIYLPIDFSDEYYGVFKVFKGKETFIFEYGYVLNKPGVTFDKGLLMLGKEEMVKEFELELTADEIVDSFRLQN